MKNKVFNKLVCRECGISSWSGIRMLWHLYSAHGIKPTKGNVVFALGNGLFCSICSVPIALLIVGIWFITWPFSSLHNYIDNL